MGLNLNLMISLHSYNVCSYRKKAKKKKNRISSFNRKKLGCVQAFVYVTYLYGSCI